MIKSSDFGVSTAVTTTTIPSDGIGNVYSTVGSTSALFNNNNQQMGVLDGIGVAGTSSSIGDTIPFTPLNDAELRRRARNNAILAKIQELEANSSIQAARSERLKIMREEYEALVRKYASNRKWNWGQGSYSNGFLTGSSNGYHQTSSYLPRYGSPSTYHQPLITPCNTSGPPYETSGITAGFGEGDSNPNQQHPQRQFQPTRDIPSNINRSFATTGVNTDITGPVRPISETRDDLEYAGGVSHTDGKKVRVVVDTESQTDQILGSTSSIGWNHLEGNKMLVVPHSKMPLASSSSATFIYDSSTKNPQQSTFSTAIEQGGKERKEISSLSTFTTGKNLSKKMEMMMLEDEEDYDDDDESLLEQRERRRKLQLQEFHQQPKASTRTLDDSVSIITSDEELKSVRQGNARAEDIFTTSNTTDEGELKRGQRQKQQSMKEKTAMERLEVMYEKKRNKRRGAADEEDSIDTTTLSLANDRKSAGAGNGNTGVSGFTDDISVSDSTSVFPKHEAQRKRLLEQLTATSSAKNEIMGKRKTKEKKPEGGSEDESDSGNEAKVIRSRIVRKNAVEEDEEDEPTTAGGGATSESIGDSFMDSVHKTPETLPEKDFDAQGIAEGTENFGTGEQAEIELVQNVPSVGEDGVVNVLVVTATAAPNKGPNREGTSELILNRSGVNDRFSKEETEIALKGSSVEIAHEPSPNEQINDAEEIRSNNLSLSKFDVAAENVEGTSEANNFSKPISKEEELKHHEQHEDVVQQKEGGEQAASENKIVDEAIELNKNGIISHSPASSANVSVHSSSSSQPTSSRIPEDEPNGAEFPEKDPAVVAAPETQRESSVGSSSTSSSRQHSLEEQSESKVAHDGTEQTKEKAGSSQLQSDSPNARIQRKENSATSTLPQSIHKRHQQLQAQVKKEFDGREMTSPPVGVEIMPEPLGTPSSSTKSVSGGGDGTKMSGGGGGTERTGKATKASPAFHQVTANATSSSPSPSSKRGVVVGEADTGNTSSAIKGSGLTGGVNNIRSSTTRSLKSSTGVSPKQPTQPTGPPGAQNTARRVRLKLNYDDSESESSEIGPVKNYPSNNSGTGNVTGSQDKIEPNNRTHSINDGAKGTDKKDKNNAGRTQNSEDDDFDDFFDI